MLLRIERLISFATLIAISTFAFGATSWNVDFQGDDDHLGVYGQTNPVDHTEAGVAWNTFEVQAFNSTINSEFESDTSMTLLDTDGNDKGVVLSFGGDLVGWSGLSGADSLVGDYLILASFAGIDTSSVSWVILGLEASAAYELTFFAHSTNGTGSPVRGIDFAMNGGVSFTQTNADPPVSVRVMTDGDGSIFGTAINMSEPEHEGNWSGLQVTQVPEPTSALFLGCTGALACLRRRRR